MGKPVEQPRQTVDEEANHRADGLPEPFKKAFYLHMYVLIGVVKKMICPLWPSQGVSGSVDHKGSLR
ncbi:hypothetical protein PSE10B_38010 [Pseudomonas amygdali pv. eriobotryae]|nr:hypothetical protein PSE10B_38010 [Pseudomonas amygdali pv. eriobotryae]